MNSILSDREIAILCRDGMIEPFEPRMVRYGSGGNKVISYGLSSFGYDIRPSGNFVVYGHEVSERTKRGLGVLDPKDMGSDPGPDAWVYSGVEHCVIPVGGYALAETLETFDIPGDVIALGTGKSSYARAGVVAYLTPFEPGWRGRATILLYNVGKRPVRVYAGEGIAQLMFFRGEAPAVTYADRGGKYQNSEGVTLTRL